MATNNPEDVKEVLSVLKATMGVSNVRQNHTEVRQPFFRIVMR